MSKIEVSNLAKWYDFRRVAKLRVQDGFTSAFRSLFGSLAPPPSHAQDRGFWALRDINFQVRAGERVGIIGTNGSGKSTLLKVLSRITAPTLGHATLRGKVSSLLDVGAGLHPDISARENIFLYGSLLGMSRSSISKHFDSIVDFSGLEKFIETPVKHYSSGMYMRLAFSVGAHLEPDILLLDEVLAVGDVHFQQKCRKKIFEMVDDGVTLMLVSHDPQEMARLCQRVLWISEGQLIADGLPDSVFPDFIGVPPDRMPPVA